MTYEYGVVIRRQRQGRPAIWQFWSSEGVAHEAPSFLAVMNWAGARGFDAFAAGNFDEAGVPEVILKRAIQAPEAKQESTGSSGGAFAKGAPQKSSPAKRAPTSRKPRSSSS